MTPLLEILKAVLPIEAELTKIHYTICEDNSVCIEMVNCPKTRPRTKNISLKYYHFQSKVKNRIIFIKYINTEIQVADICTKVLVKSQFYA